MTTRTDGELVGAYRAGDESAATALVLRHAAAVGRYLHARGADPSEVEDLVQETFFRAFRGLGDWRADASFRAWLFRIAGNHHTDQCRRGRARATVPLDGHDVAGAADPEGEVHARDLGSALRDELARLPRLQREVFLLRAQQGLEYQDIGVALGTTPGAARVHYHHAVRRLKARIR